MQVAVAVEEVMAAASWVVEEHQRRAGWPAVDVLDAPSQRLLLAAEPVSRLYPSQVATGSAPLL